MARARILKPEFWSDEKLAQVSREVRLTFAGLWTCSDDYGVTKGHPAWLKSQIFPYDTDLTLTQFQQWLADLERIGVIDPFTADGTGTLWGAPVNNDNTTYMPRHYDNIHNHRLEVR